MKATRYASFSVRSSHFPSCSSPSTEETEWVPVKSIICCSPSEHSDSVPTSCEVVEFRIQRSRHRLVPNGYYCGLNSVHYVFARVIFVQSELPEPCDDTLGLVGNVAIQSCMTVGVRRASEYFGDFSFHQCGLNCIRSK